MAISYAGEYIPLNDGYGEVCATGFDSGTVLLSARYGGVSTMTHLSAQGALDLARELIAAAESVIAEGVVA